MSMNRFLQRFGNVLHPAIKTAKDSNVVGRRFPRRHPAPQAHHPEPRKSGALDVAKFTLLSIATLPFSLWVAVFSYDYFFRVELCLEAIHQEDRDLRLRHHRDEQTTRHHGREAQLKQVRTLLSKDPHQVVLVAGANECGKSQFVSELLRGVNDDQGTNSRKTRKRGVTHIQLAQLVDSVSTFTYILVKSFNLKWLAMRYSLVDVLPFAGSEILVMKERFSDRDLAQALNVITESLKQHAERKRYPERPIIVIDGLAEGKAWTRTQDGKQCLARLFQWCIYVTKERHLAHVILTGNEELVLSLTDQNRLTRGHIEVVGLGDLQPEEARQLVLEFLPDATEEEIDRITTVFGGFVHDIRGCSRDIQDQLCLDGPMDSAARSKIVEDVISKRYWLQVERVTAAFAKGREGTEDSPEEDESSAAADEEEMDPYLDPLKSVYSEARASQNNSASMLDDGGDTAVSYTKLQLWQTLQRLVESEDGAVAFAELRDDVFDGHKAPLLELMDDDVLGFEINDSNSLGFSWKVKSATPALNRAFRYIVSDGSLKERFLKLEQDAIRQDEIEDINREKVYLWKERRALEERKAAILSTVELGDKLGRKRAARANLTSLYDSLVKEEHDALIKDRELREKIRDLKKKRREESVQPKSEHSEHEVQNHLKTALLQIMLKKDPSLLPTRTVHSRFPKLWAAFQELDVTEDGRFDARDIVRVIKEYTGKEVEIEAARKMVRSWDADDDKQLDFDEFLNMVFMTEKEDEKMKSLIHKVAK
eukprot:scaffold1513_cov141-Cylindrotheca_fusiformis.AAC.3